MKHTRPTPLFNALCLMVLTANMAFSQFTVIDDDFDGPGLDVSTWSISGWYTPHHDIANSYLDMWVINHSHSATIVSNRTDLNFFQHEITIDIKFDASVTMQPEPVLSDNPADNLVSVILATGISGTASYGDWRGSGYPGGVVIQWLPISGATDGASYLSLNGREISAMPSELSFTLNATQLTVTMTGATFKDDGSAAWQLAHGLSEGDYTMYQFVQGIVPALFNYAAHSKMDYIHITSDTEIIPVDNHVPIVPIINPEVDPAMTGTDPEAFAWYQKLMEEFVEPDGIPDAGEFDTVIYIDPSASTSGSGTSPSNPLKSWNDILTGHTTDAFQNRTAYLQKCGTHDTIATGMVVNANDVLIGAYGEGPRPILETTSQQSGDRALIEMGGGNITVRDLNLQAPHLASCVKLNTQGIVYNNEISMSGWGLRGFSPYCRIIKNIIHEIPYDGIFMSNSTNVEIGWNYIFRVNSLWVEPYTPQSVASGDCVQLEPMENWWVHHNVLDRSSSGNKFCFISNSDSQGNGTGTGLLEYNFMIGPKSTGDGGMTVYFGPGQSGYIVRYNVMTRGIGLIWHHTTGLKIYGNIFHDNGGGIVNNSNETEIYNNVFWNNNGLQISSGGIVKNNIIDNRYNTAGVLDSIVCDYNLFTFATTQSGTHNIIAADPGFVDVAKADFRLMPDSVAIDAGTDVGLALDYDGNPIPIGSAPDIGAYESGPPDPLADSDGDGILDVDEIANGTDPNNPYDPWIDADGDFVHALKDADDGDPANPFQMPLRSELVESAGIWTFKVPVSPGVTTVIGQSGELGSWSDIHTFAPVTDPAIGEYAIPANLLPPAQSPTFFRAQKTTP